MCLGCRLPRLAAGERVLATSTVCICLSLIRCFCVLLRCLDRTLTLLSQRELRDTVFDRDTLVGCQVYSVWKGSSQYPTQRVNFDNAIPLTANKQYRLELTVNNNVKVYYGVGGTGNMAMSAYYPGRTVSFSTHPGQSDGRGHDTSDAWGQFAGFYFRSVQCQ